MTRSSLRHRDDVDIERARWRDDKQRNAQTDGRSRTDRDRQTDGLDMHAITLLGEITEYDTKKILH